MHTQTHRYINTYYIRTHILYGNISNEKHSLYCILNKLSARQIMHMWTTRVKYKIGFHFSFFLSRPCCFSFFLSTFRCFFLLFLSQTSNFVCLCSFFLFKSIESACAFFQCPSVIFLYIFCILFSRFGINFGFGPILCASAYISFIMKFMHVYENYFH